MLYGQHKKQLPSSNIDYAEWVASSEGYAERHLQNIYKRERLQAFFDKGRLLASTVEEISTEYAQSLSNGMNFDLVPAFALSQPVVKDTLFDVDFARFCQIYGAESILEKMNDALLDSKRLSILLTEMSDDSLGYMKIDGYAEILDRNIEQLPPEEIGYYMDNSFDNSMIFVALASMKNLHPESLTALVNHPTSLTNIATIKALIQNPEVSPAILFKVIKNETLDLNTKYSAIESMLSDESLNRDLVIKGVATAISNTRDITQKGYRTVSKNNPITGCLETTKLSALDYATDLIETVERSVTDRNYHIDSVDNESIHKGPGM